MDIESNGLYSSKSNHHQPTNPTTTTTSTSWQRIKWTQNMVKLLITVVYHIGDDTDHKKGKWKSVSKAMTDRGFFVSPQQCEDKFNDLNKRYKRLNDLLGRGTACRVVQNHALLDTMDHLSSRAREEAHKLLNSKHLFFPEMCAFHNTCPPTMHAATTQQRQENDEEDDDDDDNNNIVDVDEEDSEFDENKSPHDSQLVSEAIAMMQTQTTTAADKVQWLNNKRVVLENERVELQAHDIELEKQRLKWQKYSRKKEHEMEKERLANQRMQLENQQMAMMLRHKELDSMEVVNRDRNG